MFTLVVDSRESTVKKELDTLLVEYITKQLDIGDFVLRNDDQVVTIMERKTYSDLDSSIISKHHKQQRQRLTEFREAHHCICCYILEGTILDSPRLRGAVENMVFKHGFSVLPTKSPKHTAQMLASLKTK